MRQPKVFQEFQPMGGVRAIMREASLRADIYERKIRAPAVFSCLACTKWTKCKLCERQKTETVSDKKCVEMDENAY
jgi:hypothetical protein